MTYYFRMNKAPGDAVCNTAFYRDLRLAHPGLRFNASISGGDAFLAHNPHIDRDVTADTPGVKVMDISYRSGLLRTKTGATVSFLESFHLDFLAQTGLSVPLTDPRPDLHLTDEEKARPPFGLQDYWVISAGGKTDMTTKVWSFERFQQVVDRTRDRVGTWVQVGKSLDGRGPHTHAPLSGVTSLIDQTSLRELMCLVYHAKGVLTGISLCMTLANAFWRPCVVLAGGREEYVWQAITPDNPALAGLADKIVTPHRYLHTQGRLVCCTPRACWAAQVVRPHTASAFPPGYICQRPVQESVGRPLPECLSMISVEDVVSAIDSYQ